MCSWMLPQILLLKIAKYEVIFSLKPVPESHHRKHCYSIQTPDKCVCVYERVGVKGFKGMSKRLRVHMFLEWNN